MKQNKLYTSKKHAKNTSFFSASFLKHKRLIKRPRHGNAFWGLSLGFAVFLAVFFLPLSVQAQEPLPGMVDIKPRKAGKGWGGHRYDHRVRFLWGFGRLSYMPGILSEAGPSWMTNSFIAPAIDSNISPVLQLSDAAKLKAWSLRAELDYTWKDRITGGIRYYSINQKHGRSEPARIDFFHPASDSKRWSYFEGVRLTKYREENKTLFVKYLHPVLFRGFKAGVYFSREWYDERNEVSFGSYVATSATSSVAPGTINWSQGGIAPVVYKMKGFSLGPAFRYQLFDWLGFHYRLTPVRRSGTMSLSGLRTIQQTTDATGAAAASLLMPFGFAQVKDAGLRHDLQAVFRLFCRYTIHIGILKEDFERSYDSYIAKTFAASPNFPYQEKTPTVLGIGEMSRKHKLSKLDFYMKFGTSFFF